MILITGATGLVGSHLILNLLTKNSNLKITALYRSDVKKQRIENWLLTQNKNLAINNINWAKADITSIPELEKTFYNINFVYHCAAIVDFDPSQQTLLNKVNIEGTANVVNLALTFGVKKLCYVSSIASLGETKLNKYIDETCEWNPEKYNGDYAISKNGGEIEVWRAIYEGLNAVIVNPGVIIGNGLWDGGSAKIYKQVNSGLPFYTKGTSGFIAVTDVVECMTKLMDTNISAQRFILVESSPTFQEVLNAVATGLNKKKPYIYASKFITNIAWRADALLCTLVNKKRTITKDTSISSHSISIYDNNKIKQVINHEFIPILPYIQQMGKEFIKMSIKK